MDRIVTIIENNAGIRNELAFEHGLSLWVEREGRAILFDTGASGAFLKNARLLGIDLSRAEAVVISHGHSDHSGGIRALYESTSFHVPLVTGPSFFDEKYAYEHGGHHFIGLDFSEAWLAAEGIEHRVVGNGAPVSSFEIIPGVHILNGFKRTHPEEADSSRFVVARGAPSGPVDFEIDDYRDEICLVVETKKGLVVVLGCAHPGVMNMVDQVRANFGGNIRAVLGGTHLMDADAKRAAVTIDYLRSLGCERLGIAHCSGATAAALIAEDPATYYAMRTGSGLLF
ncbi:MAG: MBL fold metallo-hydrolase [Treponemataceae bacterium]